LILPELSIAIPFHRGLGYLQAAVESVRAQHDACWELLICDDCGDEESALLAYLDSMHDARIRYHRTGPAQGMVANWNQALGLAKGELVTLLHQDDLLEAGYVGRMRALAAAHPEHTALHCAARIIDARGEARFSLADWYKGILRPRQAGLDELAGEAGFEALLRGNFVMCPTLCFQKRLLGELCFDARWKQVQDLDLLCRLLLGGHRLLGCPEVLYAYRRHKAAATSLQSESLLRFEEERDLLDRMAEQAVARGWQGAAKIGRAKRVVKAHLAYLSLADLLHLRLGPARKKLRFLRSLWR